MGVQVQQIGFGGGHIGCSLDVGDKRSQGARLKAHCDGPDVPNCVLNRGWKAESPLGYRFAVAWVARGAVSSNYLTMRGFSYTALDAWWVFVLGGCCCRS